MGDTDRRHRRDVKALRDALGLTQEQVADAGGIDRTDVSKVETGWNHGSSNRVRRALAAGLGLSRDDMDDFMDGRLAVADAVERSVLRHGTATEAA